MLFGVFQQLAAQLARDENGTDLALERYLCSAPLGGLHGDIPHLGHPDAGGADGLQHQRQAGAARLPGGTDQIGVLLGGDLAFLGAVRLVLNPQAVNAAVLAGDHAEKTVQRGQDGVDAAGGVGAHKVGLVVQHGVALQRRVAQPQGEALDVAEVFVQGGGGFLLVFQQGAKLRQLVGCDGHGGPPIYIMGVL